jgi:choline-sulfatase
MPSKANILVICSDQHNPAVTGCYGNEIVETPNIDRLARRATTYANAYCSQPICVPSRMSFMTGKYPSRIGVLGNNSVLDSRIPTYAHMCIGAGYRTVLAGRMHFVGPDQYHGFQERIGSDYTAYAFHCAKINRYNPLNGLLGNGGVPDPLLEVGQGVTCTQQMDKDTTAAAEKWLKAHNDSGCDMPFMMTVGYFSPHCPYIAEEEYYQRYKGRVTPAAVSTDEVEALHPYHRRHREAIQIDRIPEKNLEKAAAAYYGLVDFLDDEIGKLVGMLERTGLIENTIVIYFSDHGEMLGEHGRWHKSTFFEASSRVPLIIQMPEADGNLGTRVDTPVSLVDVLPTICDLVDREIDFEIDGRSLLDSPDPDRPLFVEYHDEYGSHRMIRQGPWKLNYYAGFESYELFNLDDDPHETTNLATSEEHEEVRWRLQEELFKDGWSGDIISEHNRLLKSIGCTEVSRSGTKTRELIEAGVITEVPGYDVDVSWYDNRIEDD